MNVNLSPKAIRVILAALEPLAGSKVSPTDPDSVNDARFVMTIRADLTRALAQSTPVHAGGGG